MSAGAAVELQAVTVQRGERTVLTDVSFSVRPGECVALVGPNGAGKSTAVAAACGDVAVAGGSVLLNGTPLASVPARERARQRAVMTQHTDVAFGFTVREVVTMAREPWRGTEQAEHDRGAVDAALAEADIAHLAERPVQALSGGEQARVALARTLAQRTPIIIWDEPTAALDLRHQIDALRGLRSRVSNGAAAIVVLHDLTQVASVADRVVVLHDGVVAGDGIPADILTADLIRTVYGVQVSVMHSDDSRLVIVPRMLPQ